MCYLKISFENFTSYETLTPHTDTNNDLTKIKLIECIHMCLCHVSIHLQLKVLNVDCVDVNHMSTMNV